MHNRDGVSRWLEQHAPEHATAHELAQAAQALFKFDASEWRATYNLACRYRPEQQEPDPLTVDERKAVEYWRVAGLKRGGELLAILDRIAPKPKQGG